MRARVLVFVIAARLALGVSAQTPAPPYFPERSDWQRRSPADAGVDAAALDDAVTFAISNENPGPRDPVIAHAQTFGATEPFDALVGPVKERGALNGLVIRHGYVVAEWGETTRVDMTHSVTKTFLSTVVGLAFHKGLIRSLDDRVGPYLPPGPLGAELFASPHNQSITWDHLLRQTSDWQGTLWDKPDWADRPEGPASGWANRKLSPPGTRYKYNDVRVNLLALAALHVLRRPLPEVLREDVMDPIGASSTWRWHGYDNSWIEIDGRRIQSVSGGGHWGGGMFINAWDMARFGYLFLRNGTWAGRPIVSSTWIGLARTPGTVNRNYGFMNWYLNTGRTSLPSTPETSVTFRGNGQNIVYVDWEHDLVVVVRWIGGDKALDGFLGRVVAAIRS